MPKKPHKRRYLTHLFDLFKEKLQEKQAVKNENLFFSSSLNSKALRRWRFLQSCFWSLIITATMAARHLLEAVRSPGRRGGRSSGALGGCALTAVVSSCYRCPACVALISVLATWPDRARRAAN